jgi:DNA end-binding protein Ku
MAKKRAARAQKETDSEKPANGRAPGRPMWSGSISFGLVNIPIKLYPGIRAKDVRFHILHEKDKARVQERLVCSAEQKEISRDETVKGFEIAKDQHVILTQEEISSLAPKASRTIELMNIVELSQIDPIYFNRPFYIVPEEQAAKAYFVFLEALKTSKKAAIAKFVMRNREYIGAIRPIKSVLCMDTLHFADELVQVDDLQWTAPDIHPREAEVKMALQLLESFEADFNPKELHDDYRDALLKVIRQKAEGEEIAPAPQPEEEAPQVIDLMEALKKSVAQAQRHRPTRAA